MKYWIDQENILPIYKQIVNQTLEAINRTELKNGDKLPGERSLSKDLQISRGTITKAYNELANLEAVTLVKGKGCYVSKEKEYLSLSRKEKAVAMIKNTVESLTELGFSLSEIRIFSEIVLMEQEKNYGTIRIGIIDCNREALHAVHCQIGKIKDLTISKYLLEELDFSSLKEEIIHMDLLITTYTHYEQVVASIPIIEGKLIRVAMTPSKKTLVEIKRISRDREVGILYDSENFLSLIRLELRKAGISEVSFQKIGSKDEDKQELSQFVKQKAVIILPPFTFFDMSYRRFLMMKLKGKQTIEFDYLIERGNFLYVEEEIRHLMIAK